MRALSLLQPRYASFSSCLALFFPPAIIGTSRGEAINKIDTWGDVPIFQLRDVRRRNLCLVREEAMTRFARPHRRIETAVIVLLATGGAAERGRMDASHVSSSSSDARLATFALQSGRNDAHSHNDLRR